MFTCHLPHLPTNQELSSRCQIVGGGNTVSSAYITLAFVSISIGSSSTAGMASICWCDKLLWHIGWQIECEWQLKFLSICGCGGLSRTHRAQFGFDIRRHVGNWLRFRIASVECDGIWFCGLRLGS